MNVIFIDLYNALAPDNFLKGLNADTVAKSELLFDNKLATLVNNILYPINKIFIVDISNYCKYYFDTGLAPRYIRRYADYIPCTPILTQEQRIHKWIFSNRHHMKVDSFAIIDNKDYESFKNHVVKINSNTGITKTKLLEALNIIKNVKF